MGIVTHALQSSLLHDISICHFECESRAGAGGIARERTGQTMHLSTEGAVGLTQGFVISFDESSTGWWAILQLLCNQEGNKS